MKGKEPLNNCTYLMYIIAYEVGTPLNSTKCKCANFWKTQAQEEHCYSKTSILPVNNILTEALIDMTSPDDN